MRILICDDIFPAMMEILTRLLPEDEIRCCTQEQVPEEAGWAAVTEGIIAGADLDVLTSEPPAPGHPLLNHDRIVVTPHTAGVTEQSFSALGHAVPDNIVWLKQGRPLSNTISV